MPSLRSNSLRRLASLAKGRLPWKATLAKKIGFLLLLFNFTGILALVSVSWLVESRVPEYDLRAEVSRQRRAARQLQAALASAPASHFREALHRGRDSFEDGLRDLKQLLGDADATDERGAFSRELDRLDRIWERLEPRLDRAVQDPGWAESAREDLKTETASLEAAAERFAETASIVGARDRGRRIFRTLAGACLLNALLFVLGMLLTRNYITRPVRLLDNSVRQLRRGSLHEVPVITRDELANLTVAFNEMSRDIQEKARLEEQLRQSQKMEAIGLLSGGIAHDFNNILTVIFAHADSLLESAEPDVRTSAGQLRAAADRAAALTRQLLAFSRKQVLQPAPVNPGGIVQASCAMLRRLIGENIRIEMKLESSGNVHADPGALEQVLMNLAVNARDAMTHGGVLTFRTESVSLNTPPNGAPTDFQPGSFIVLSVEDTGIGMDAATQKRVFEPFFTTKPRGRGTGLGLSTVYGIVKQSGGFITVASTVGSGSVFSVYLPRVESSSAAQPSSPASPMRAEETILLVEDERAVRDVTAEGLRKLGYRVLSVGSAAEAGRLCSDSAVPIDLVLTDVIMPTGTGAELAAELRTLRPGIRVLFMSGYTDDALLRCGLSSESIDFIAKPFDAAQLHRRIHEMLEAPAAVAAS